MSQAERHRDSTPALPKEMYLFLWCVGCRTPCVWAQACPLRSHVVSLSITVPGCSRGWASSTAPSPRGCWEEGRGAGKVLR